MIKITEDELCLVVGGSFWSEMSRLFGREGKPFLGRDLVEAVVGIGAAAAASAGPAGIAAYSSAIGTLAASATSKVYDQARKGD